MRNRVTTWLCIVLGAALLGVVWWGEEATEANPMAPDERRMTPSPEHREHAVAGANTPTEAAPAFEDEDEHEEAQEGVVGSLLGPRGPDGRVIEHHRVLQVRVATRDRVPLSAVTATARRSMNAPELVSCTTNFDGACELQVMASCDLCGIQVTLEREGFATQVVSLPHNVVVLEPARTLVVEVRAPSALIPSGVVLRVWGEGEHGERTLIERPVLSPGRISLSDVNDVPLTVALLWRSPEETLDTLAQRPHSLAAGELSLELPLAHLDLVAEGEVPDSSHFIIRCAAGDAHLAQAQRVEGGGATGRYDFAFAGPCEVTLSTEQWWVADERFAPAKVVAPGRAVVRRRE